jgi:outer membrane protein insertion porin family
MLRHPGSPLALLLLTALAVRAQEATQQEPQDPAEGRIVEQITVEPDQTPSLGRIQAALASRIGKPFRAAVMRQDMRTLWSDYKVMTRVDTELLPSGGVRLIVQVVMDHTGYKRVAFKGNSAMSESQLRSLLGPAVVQNMTDFAARSHARAIESSYRRDGYYYCRVGIETDDRTETLTFRIDEGPKVTVRQVIFRGNDSVPTRAPIGLYRNLLTGSGMSSQPAGALLPGSVYSEETVEEDLGKLRAYYRGIGFRDALVELVAVTPAPDLDEVDLTFRIVEGPRYRIASLAIEQLGPEGVPDYRPQYPLADLQRELKVQPGDFYDRDRLQLDRRALERYYGRRGHPPQGRYGRALTDALEISEEPVESFDFDKHEVRLTWQIREGSPKRLHDVVIRGNTRTQDRVVRRKVLLEPGEILDLDRVERSLAALDSLQYFTDPETLASVRFELQPVEGRPDEVDLVILVQEGETGRLTWGVGISTGAGLTAQIQFAKRNFDLTRVPSTLDPAGMLGEIVRGEAFHGGGQDLEILLAPGTEISMFRILWFDPDIFRRHHDTIGLKVLGRRQIRRMDGYDTDTLGGALTLSRQFTERWRVGLTLRDDTIDIEDVEANSPKIVFDAEGDHELRSLAVQFNYHDLDHPLRPSEGLETMVEFEYGGGALGAQVDFWRLRTSIDNFWAFYRDSYERPHVLRSRLEFDYAQDHDSSQDLFLAERTFLGGSNLRGFDQRGAGPKQFGTPVGGEVRLTAGLEYNFPIVSTRTERALRETELLRGCIFADYGQLGLKIDDPTFEEIRLSLGFGVRIFVPVLGVPIALDLGWPLLYEETDSRRQLFFSLWRQ